MNPHAPTSIAEPHLSAWQQWARRLYLLATSLVGMSIVVQVFFAGAAVLVNPTYWSAHRAFAHTIEYLVIVLLLLGLVTRLPWRLQALGGLLYVLLFLQYTFLHLMPRMGIPILRALHTVNALALFSVALVLALRIWQHMRR